MMIKMVHSQTTKWMNTLIKMPESTGLIKDEDPEIAAMSEAELRELALSAFGMWADREDVGEEWLDDLRSSWDDRLDELYNGPSGTL